jgi:hypothetical protein
LIIVGFILSARFVYAENFLDYLFKPLGGISVVSFYDNYWYAVDFMLYLIVFLGVARVSLEKKFTGRGGKALIVVLGLMLTIAMTWIAESIGFKIANLWPVAAGLFMAIIAFLIFRLMAEQGAKLGKGVATAYVVTFLVVQAVMPELFGPDGWIATKTPIIWGIANIVFLVAIVYMIGELARFFTQGRKTEGRDGYPLREREGRPGEGYPGERPGERDGERRPGEEGPAHEREPGAPHEPGWNPEITNINNPPFLGGKIREDR